jgi:hypothetical protein
LGAAERLGNGRQVDGEGGSPARFGLATNSAAALLDDSQNGGESQAGSLAGLLGGEERLEEMRPRVRVHSNPGVAHGHRHVAARRQAPNPGIGLRQSRVGRGNGQRAAPGHGVARVQGKVHDGAADFAGVGLHLPEAARAIDNHLDPLADQTAQHSLEVADDDIQVQHFGLQHLPPAEGQQLLGE